MNPVRQSPYFDTSSCEAASSCAAASSETSENEVLTVAQETLKKLQIVEGAKQAPRKTLFVPRGSSREMLDRYMKILSEPDSTKREKELHELAEAGMLWALGHIPYHEREKHPSIAIQVFYYCLDPEGAKIEEALIRNNWKAYENIYKNFERLYELKEKIFKYRNANTAEKLEAKELLETLMRVDNNEKHPLTHYDAGHSAALRNDRESTLRFFYSYESGNLYALENLLKEGAKDPEFQAAYKESLAIFREAKDLLEKADSSPFYELGKKYYEAGKQDIGEKTLHSGALIGGFEENKYLATIYKDDFQKAYRYLTAAANQGDLDCLEILLNKMRQQAENYEKHIALVCKQIEEIGTCKAYEILYQDAKKYSSPKEAFSYLQILTKLSDLYHVTLAQAFLFGEGTEINLREAQNALKIGNLQLESVSKREKEKIEQLREQMHQAGKVFGEKSTTLHKQKQLEQEAKDAATRAKQETDEKIKRAAVIAAVAAAKKTKEVKAESEAAKRTFDRYSEELVKANKDETFFRKKIDQQKQLALHIQGSLDILDFISFIPESIPHITRFLNWRLEQIKGKSSMEMATFSNSLIAAAKNVESSDHGKAFFQRRLAQNPSQMNQQDLNLWYDSLELFSHQSNKFDPDQKQALLKTLVAYQARGPLRFAYYKCLFFIKNEKTDAIFATLHPLKKTLDQGPSYLNYLYGKALIQGNACDKNLLEGFKHFKKNLKSTTTYARPAECLSIAKQLLRNQESNPEDVQLLYDYAFKGVEDPIKKVEELKLPIHMLAELQYNLGLAKGDDELIKKSLKSYQKAIENKEVQAFFNCGQIYQYSNPQEALKFFEQGEALFLEKQSSLPTEEEKKIENLIKAIERRKHIIRQKMKDKQAKEEAFTKEEELSKEAAKKSEESALAKEPKGFKKILDSYTDNKTIPLHVLENWIDTCHENGLLKQSEGSRIVITHPTEDKTLHIHVPHGTNEVLPAIWRQVKDFVFSS